MLIIQLARVDRHVHKEGGGIQLFYSADLIWGSCENFNKKLKTLSRSSRDKS